MTLKCSNNEGIFHKESSELSLKLSVSQIKGKGPSHKLKDNKEDNWINPDLNLSG